MILTMQDYSKFGVVQTEDKRKLFQIIQQQKQNKCKDGSKRMASVIDRLTSSGILTFFKKLSLKIVFYIFDKI